MLQQNLRKKLWKKKKKFDWVCLKRSCSKHLLVFIQLPSKHLLVFKTSWRRLQDMSRRRLQHVFSVTILRLPRRFQDLSQELLRWRHLQHVLKTCLEDVFLEDMSWRRLEDISWRCLEDISWRRLQDVLDANKIFTGDICI